MLNLKTYHAKTQDVETKWVLVDASDKALGRLASGIAKKLLGKDNPRYTPGVDISPYIVVINAKNVRCNGDKNFFWHTGYPGGIKKESMQYRLENKPDALIMKAVQRMLPRNRYGRHLLTKLRIFVDSDHIHQAQNPEAIEI